MNLKQSLTKSLLKGFVAFALIIVFGAYINANQSVEYGGDRPVVDGSSVEVFSNTDCDDVPTGEFPTGVVIRFVDGHVEFSDSPGDTNYFFKVAVGELPLNPIYREFTLCK